MTNRSLLRTTLLAAACLLITQGVRAETPARPGAEAARAAAPATVDSRWAALEHSRWIADGRSDAPRKIYVFTDPNCPYCTKLWSDARPWVESGKVQLRHVIVGVLTATSPGKAAALLGDKDPGATLAAYEGAHAFAVVRMLASGRPHPVEDTSLKPVAVISGAIQAELAGNLRLMQSLGIQGTPGVVSLGAGGKVEARQGLQPGELAQVFGPR